MAKLTLGQITGGYQTADQYNANNALIEAAIENTISRDGATPNVMDALFDMNSYDINNVGITRTERLFINGQEASITLGGLFDLDGLTDVTIAAVANLDALMYNSGTGLWENRPLVEADISDLGSYSPTGHTHVEADITDLQTYLLASEVSAFGLTLIDDATAGAARTTLGVDPAGTDNSTNVTLVGTGTYLSITGQAITVDPITESDISDLGSYLPLAGGTITGDLRTVGTTMIGEDVSPSAVLQVNDNGTAKTNLFGIMADNGSPWHMCVQNEVYSTNLSQGLRIQVSSVGAGSIYAPDDGVTPGDLVLRTDAVDAININGSTQNVIIGADLQVGKNGGGDSIVNFYDDTNNTARSIFWDDSEGAFFFEDNTGAFQQFGTGSGGGPDFLLGGM